MAPRNGFLLSGLVGSDSEMDDMLGSSVLQVEDMENLGAEKRRGRPKGSTNKSNNAKKTLMSKTAKSVNSGSKKPALSAKTSTNRRKALREQTNGQAGSDTEDTYGSVDDLDEDSEMVPKRSNMNTEALDEPDVKRIGTKSRLAPKAKAQASRKRKTPSEDAELEIQATQGYDEQSFAEIEVPKTAPAQSSKIIAETQASQEPEDDAEEDIDMVDDGVYGSANALLSRADSRPGAKTARPGSKVSRLPPSHRNGGHASDVEKAIDPSARRKLGELTRKFESLDMKYRALQEVGIKDAETNFEKLKKQTDLKSKAANDLVQSLKLELSSQNALVQRARSLQKELATRDAELSQKTKQFQKELAARDAELAELRAQNQAMGSTLADSQAEAKTLSAKLSASRNAYSYPAGSESGRIPSSAVKGSAASRSAAASNAEAAQLASLKEDLYGDLTGLILRNVKKEQDADVYDCLQTGRNGSKLEILGEASEAVSNSELSALHFKLAIEHNEGGSYEESECHYTPLIDENRDRDLIELLPDYLTEEITFPRERAGMFYSRIVMTLTKQMSG